MDCLLQVASPSSSVPQATSQSPLLIFVLFYAGRHMSIMGALGEQGNFGNEMKLVLCSAVCQFPCLN